MKECKKCNYKSDHPLGITINHDGICSGCIVHEEKDFKDWEKEQSNIIELVKQYKSKKRNIHDCIVPVSGGRDSFFTLHLVKNILKLNPLLVSYNSQYNSPTGIRNLSKLVTAFGCDIIKLTIDPSIIRRINKQTFEYLDSIYWHVLAGETVLPVNISVKFKIPLIIWGCHQGIDQVGMFSHNDKVEMTRRYRKDHDLMGFEAEDFAKEKILSHKDLHEFMYPSDQELSNNGTRGIYLNNYFRWDTMLQHKQMVEEYNFETRQLKNTFDNCNDTHCEIHNSIHDLLKLKRLGYSRITDHVNREIRFNRINKDQSKILINFYEDQIASSISFKDVFLMTGINEKEFKSKLKKLDSKFLNNMPKKNRSTKSDFEKVKKSLKIPSNEFAGVDDNRKKPILLGRGWHD